MPPIEKLEPMSKMEKWSIKTKNFLKIKAISYGVSAAVGAGVGYKVQEMERAVTGYSPDKHEKVIKDIAATKEKVDSFEEFKKQQTEKRKNSIKEMALGFLSDIKEKIKQNGVDPKKYLENTEMYRNLLSKYYDTLKFIDDVSLLAPALLMFIMLGGFLSRKLTEMKGDAVQKEQITRIIAKINELADNINAIYGQIQKNGPESLTEAVAADVRRVLIASKEAFPEAESLIEDKVSQERSSLEENNKKPPEGSELS